MRIHTLERPFTVGVTFTKKTYRHRDNKNAYETPY